MLRFLFRIKRRIGRELNKLLQNLWLFELKKIYKNRLLVGKGLVLGEKFSIHFDISNSEVLIGGSVQFRDFCQIRTGINSKLKVGNRVFFNNNCRIHCFHGITIGDDCQFGENVKFYDINHKFNDLSTMISKQGYNGGNIEIGKNCWFGSDVTILKGVKIGDNVVIGAGCLIYESIPPNVIVTSKQELNFKTITHAN